MKDRIKKIRKKSGFTQSEFGGKIGVAGNTVTNYENGTRTPMNQTIQTICKTFNISEAWLRDGLEPMELPPNEDFSFLIDQVLAGESETAKALFKALAVLDERDWQAVQKIIDELKK